MQAIMKMKNNFQFVHCSETRCRSAFGWKSPFGSLLSFQGSQTPSKNSQKNFIQRKTNLYWTKILLKIPSWFVALENSFQFCIYWIWNAIVFFPNPPIDFEPTAGFFRSLSNKETWLDGENLMWNSFWMWILNLKTSYKFLPLHICKQIIVHAPLQPSHLDRPRYDIISIA